MVAYLNKTKNGYELTVVEKPCNGIEFNKGMKIAVEGKREAKNICKKLGYVTYNF